MCDIEHVNGTFYDLVNCFGKPHKAQSLKSGIYQQIDIAFVRSGAFGKRTEQNGMTDPIPVKNRRKQLRQFFDRSLISHRTAPFPIF